MGQWDATILGNHAARVAIAQNCDVSDPKTIHAACEDALALPASTDGHVAAAWMLAPASGARVLAMRRSALAEHDGSHVFDRLAKLAELEAVRPHRFGARSGES
jgi:hypothetical protein